MTRVRFDPVGSVEGRLRPPSDKSISHRALLLSAMAEGESRLVGVLDSADTNSTLAAIQLLGAGVSQSGPDRVSEIKVEGVGLRGAQPAQIDVGNSGTLIRLLIGWLAGQAPTGGGDPGWTLSGDSSVSSRPMDRVVEPLAELGARVDCADGVHPPVRVAGSKLSGGALTLPVASAQVKSALLLAGLNADAAVSVTEPIRSRNHTELMLSSVGVGIEVDDRTVTVSPCERLDALDLEIPADPSSAAFLLVAGLLLEGSQIELVDVCLNPTRSGLLEILSSMGAGESVSVYDQRESSGELIGNLSVRPASLRGVEVDPDLVPMAIDELPLVGLLGCFAQGETRVTGAAELRVKESDRIAAVVEGLSGIGAEIEALPDGFVVTGTGGLEGGVIDSRGDHRLAMLGAIAGLVSREGVEVEGFDSTAVSYPGFEADLRAICV